MRIAHLSRSLILIPLISSNLFLSACTPFVKYPHSPILSKETAAGTVGGASLGAEAAAATSASVAAGAGIGALVGGGIGTYMANEARWLRKLQKENIQVVQIGDQVRIIIPSDGIFLFNTAAIYPQKYPVLADVTGFIENYGTVPITVNGYGDNVGSPGTKLKLTSEQAKSVAAFLWSHGIPYENLRALGHGSAASVATNTTSVGSAYNRRIEITFPVDFSHSYI